MKVRLTATDPHPFPGAREDLYSDWWGREIEIGDPRIPAEPHACGTHTIWRVIGPPELVDLINRNKVGPRYICIHLIATEANREQGTMEERGKRDRDLQDARIWGV